MANNFLRIKTLFDILFQKVKTLTTLVDNSITKISTEFSVGDYSTTVPVQYWRRTTYDISYANWTSYTTYNKNSYVNIAGNTENSFVCLYDNCVGENPDNCWGTRTVSSLPSGKYVWSRMATYYANYKTPIYSDAICITSYDNGEVTSTSFSYGVTNSLAIDNPETEIDWQTDIPAVNDGQYLWIRTIIDYTDESVPDTVSYMYQRKGSGASSSISAYTSVDSQSIECSLDGKVLNDTTITIPFGAYSGTTRIACTASVSGITASSGLSYITESSTSSSEGNVVITIPKGSTLDEQSVFNLTIDISVSGLPFSKNLCITKAVNGKEINSIKSVTYYYITTVTENKPDINADWKSEDNKPVVTPVNKYLWQKEVMVFTSSSTQTRINLLAVYGDAGAAGTAGDSVSVYSIMYQIGTSATEPPTETWSTSIVEPTNANQYLWTRNVMFKTSGYWKATAYTTDGTTTWSATKSYVAGDAVVVNGITEYSYSCVVANTNKVPAVKYTAYSIAKKGEQGLQGDKGEDGYTPIKGVDYFDGKSAYEIAVDKGYSGTELEWLKSLEGIDGTNGKDGTRGSAVYVASVDFASGSYTLGSYRINVNNLTPLISGVVVSAGDVAYYSTSTISKYYPITTVETIGSTTYAYADTFLDVRGKDGTNGKDGKDGTSAYLHYAYSTSSDGKENFSITPFAGAIYLGLCTDDNEADPTTYTSYSWSKIKGDDGKDGNIYSNLVINGFGENATLAPWTSGAYVSGDSPQGCKGYFKSRAMSDYIDYDPNIKYELSYWSRLDPSLTDASTDYYDYFAVIPHDVDKLLIDCYMTPSFNSSVFKLAKDFNYGDEYMYFEDLSNWNTTQSYGWYIAIYDYTDSCGYKYPTGTYTRNVLCFYKNAKVDVANKRIYVKDAKYYCKPTTKIPAETEVMQHYDRSTYPYYGQHGKITNTEWFHWVNLIVDAYADPMYWASGLRVARYIRVGFAAYNANLAGVMLKPISEAADDTLTDIQYRYCATSGNIPNISTSTWYISISDALNKGSGSNVYAYLTFYYRNGTTSRMREPVLVYNGSNSIAATDWYFATGTNISCPSSISKFPTGWPYSTWFTFSRGIASKLKLSEQYPGLFAYCKVTTNAGKTTAYGPYLVKTTAPQIQKMVRQYYLSTSKTALTGGVWSDAAPTSIPKDTYVWTRLALLYDSGWEYTKEQHMADVTYITSKLYEVNNTLTETCITKSEFNTGLAQKVSTSTYNNKTNQIDQRLSSLEQTANTVNLHFGANGDYTKHFSFSSSGLEIKGGTSSDIKCVIDNDSFAFVDKSNVEQLTLTTNGAELHSAKIDTTLQLGNESTNTTDWRIRETANKNLIIDWIGG